VRHRTKSRGWYLAVVPAVAFALAASSFRYVDVYLPNTPSDPITGAVGETLHIEQTAVAEGVENLIVADVTLTGAARLREEDEPSLPAGTEIDVIAVSFDWAAPPESPLRTCDLQLVTVGGEHYLPSARLGSHLVGAAPELSSTHYCTPEDAPGPLMSLGVDLGFSGYEDPERPAEWSTTVYFVVPAGTRPASVKLSWQMPTYLEFTGVEVSGEEALSSLSSAGAMNTSAAMK